MRVDVGAEFYVRVKPTEEAIADAAQTLGHRTLETDRLKELVEGKFVDSLRAVAAEMSMEELHEQRVDFVQKVQTAVSEDLLKNGLELESVSLTSMDQTDREFFNPNNAFDAEGLTKLTEEIEARRKKRNDIEQDTIVAVELKNLEAERQKLEIARDTEYARLSQEREVEIRRAEQGATIAKEQADQQRAAQEAQIAAQQEVEQTRIKSERAVEQERIDKDRAIKEADIARARTVENADIQRQESVAITEQSKQIAIAQKSKEESEARSEADRALAVAVEAEEAVRTVRDTATADRQKQIELIEAAKQAEREAIGITVAAEAEKQAAIDQAEAIKTLADGKASELRIEAEGEAHAEKVRADAAQMRYTVDAEGKRALNEAENLLSQEVIAMRIKLALIQNLDRIVAESVKPMEAIEGIKIVQVDGLGGGTGNGTGHGGGNGASADAGGSLADQAVNAALRYRSQAPLLDSLLKEVGIDGGSLDGITAAVNPAPGANGAAPEDDAS